MVRSPSSLLSLEQIVQLTAGTQVQAASVNAFAISTSKVSVRGAFVASAQNCRRFLSSHSERTQKITIREKKTQFETKKARFLTFVNWRYVTFNKTKSRV